MNVHKVTLSSDKVVLLRDPKIGDQELAVQAAANSTSSDNAHVLALASQKEMLKILLVQVDDKKVTPKDVEDLDKLLSMRDYRECIEVIAELTGMDEEGAKKKLKREYISTGGK